VLFSLLFSKSCCFSGIVLHLLARLKAPMGVVQGYEVFNWVQNGRGVKLFTHLDLVPRLIISAAISLLPPPPNVFMA
jgi:hypothetical protein